MTTYYTEGSGAPANVDPDRWNDIVASSNGHIFQTSHWSEVLARFGVESVPFIFEDRSIMVVHKVPMLSLRAIGRRYCALQVLRGPVFKSQGFERAVYQDLVERMVAYARSEGILRLNVFPNLPASDIESTNYLSSKGFVPVYETGAFHTQTYVLDCRPSDEEIIHRMEKRTRWALRKAQAVATELEEGIDEQTFDSFYELYRNSAPFPQTRDFLRTVLRILGNRGLARIFLLSIDGQPAAGIFGLMFGMTFFHVWAATNHNLRKAYPGVLLPWEAIKWARSNNYKYYDFHGALVQDIEKYNPDEKVLQVALFKRGFGGTLVRYAPQHRMITHPLKHWVITAARNLIAMHHVL